MSAADQPGRRLRVMLLFGGRSAEHDVSRVTAVAVAAALDPARYEVVPVAITTEGQWLFADSARRHIERAAEVGPRALPVRFDVDGEVAAGLGDLVATGGVSAAGALDVDVVLPLLHGPYGEDGTVQGLFELAAGIVPPFGQKCIEPTLSQGVEHPEPKVTDETYPRQRVALSNVVECQKFDEIQRLQHVHDLRLGGESLLRGEPARFDFYVRKKLVECQPKQWVGLVGWRQVNRTLRHCGSC